MAWVVFDVLCRPVLQHAMLCCLVLNTVEQAEQAVSRAHDCSEAISAVFFDVVCPCTLSTALHAAFNGTFSRLMPSGYHGQK